MTLVLGVSMPRAKVQGWKAPALLGALLLRGMGQRAQEVGVPSLGQPGDEALAGEPQGPQQGSQVPGTGHAFCWKPPAQVAQPHSAVPA